MHPEGQRYRIDFALTTLTGNQTRYDILRRQVVKDQTVDARFVAIRTWYDEDPLRVLPGAIRLRLRQQLDSASLYRLHGAECVVLHTFETTWQYTLYAKDLRRRSLKTVINPDGNVTTSAVRGRVTPWLWQRTVDLTDLFLLWTNWGVDVLLDDYPSVPREKIAVIHPGMELERWPQRRPPERGELFRLLFLGGDMLRKGLDVLLDAMDGGLNRTCRLDVCTQDIALGAYPELHERILRTPGVTLHRNLRHGDDELRTLFETSDAMVLPTRSDAAPWVLLEAMATGIPCVSTSVGAIPEMLGDGAGVVVPPGDADALGDAIDRLRQAADGAAGMVQAARRNVEERYDTNRNTPEMLRLLKELIEDDGGRSPAPDQAPPSVVRQPTPPS